VEIQVHFVSQAGEIFPHFDDFIIVILEPEVLRAVSDISDIVSEAEGYPATEAIICAIRLWKEGCDWQNTRENA
jgi:hypothetical protein